MCVEYICWFFHPRKFLRKYVYVPMKLFRNLISIHLLSDEMFIVIIFASGKQMFFCLKNLDNDVFILSFSHSNETFILLFIFQLKLEFLSIVASLRWIQNLRRSMWTSSIHNFFSWCSYANIFLLYFRFDKMFARWWTNVRGVFWLSLNFRFVLTSLKKLFTISCVD